MPTSGDVNPDVLRTTIGLITAWTTRGDGVADLSYYVAAAVREHDPGAVIEAQARVTAGILRGVEMAVDRLLSDPRLLAHAVEQMMRRHPVRAKDIGLDRLAVLARVGLSSASD